MRVAHVGAFSTMSDEDVSRWAHTLSPRELEHLADLLFEEHQRS